MLKKNAAEGVHVVEDAFTNWFLLEDGGALTVVDTGHPRSWRSLQRALTALGRSPADVAAVVLTHAHFDHMGFAARAHRELGVPVWAHERERELVRRPWSYEHERSRLRYAANPRFVAAFAAMGAAGALWVRGLDDVRTFGDEGELDVPGRPRIVFTPGHTHGHCAFHLPDRGAVIAGDAVVTFDPYTTRRGPRIVAGAATADSARALASLDALAATGAQTLLPGHGGRWTAGAAAAVEQARAHGPS
ncbi:MAG: MBL fold metallo-hydrolase [Thermoleophilia bacterium]|nr:MBL fold metallo-hydrolase [Thermoleophilia bacterium]